jgi:outer membrane protein OmpA-like peptidoglycan-associated protein
MTSIDLRGMRGWLALPGLAVAILLGACAAAPPQALSLTGSELPFDEAVARATDGLVAQTQKLPAFLAKVESRLSKHSIVLDPMLDARTGEQTQATQVLERRVTERITAKFASVEILPFRSDNLARAQYLLNGTMTHLREGASKGALRIDLALTDLRGGKVVAQASALARDDGLDHTPLPYYQDSPVLVKDKVIEGYIRTAATPPGQPADAYYFERVAVATVISEATTAYDARQYQDALAKYLAAGGAPGGDQLRVLNGIYLAEVKLGKMDDAELAFGKVVAYGIGHDQLGVKFLFNPGSTEFWSDRKVSGVYEMWLRQIAKQADAAKVCMSIVGHTSHTGSEQFNDTLSLRRASYVLQRLATEAPALTGRATPIGKGFRENIVGSGTDNAVDALDRRVEFRIVPCT